MKKVLSVVLLILFCAGTGKAWHSLRDGFSINRLSGWNQEIPGIWWEEDADAAIQQKFYYLSRGRQCFAFISEDGQYVIKLPRADYFRLPFWLKAINLAALDARRANFTAEKRRRERFLLQSFQISFDELKDVTALIGMNLSNQGNRERVLQIADSLGRSFKIPLKDTYFLLQHRKLLFKDVFKDAVAKEGIEGAERVIDTLLDVIIERAKRGIFNKDGSFLRNFAYDDHKAYQIDVGSFYRKEDLSLEESYVKSIEYSIGPVREWIEKEDPEWLTLLDKKLHVIYETGLQ